jgi:hypothetical protein
MKKLLLTILFAGCAQADMLCPCDCVPVTPTAAPTVTPTRTATPIPTATHTPVAQPTVKVINYTESQAIIGNPEIGFQTTQRPLNEVSNPRGIPSTSEVFRFYAEEINPSPGVFTWAILDNAISKARSAGQTLNVRIIMYDPYGGNWLRGTIPGRTFRETSEGNGTYFAPDWNSNAVLAAHKSLLQAVSARYANNPTIEHVDIGSVGSYGEWHHWAMVDAVSGSPVPMPSESSVARILQDYRDAFVGKSLIFVLDGEFARKYGKDFAGWRKDCAGGGHETNAQQYPKWMINPVDLRNQWQNFPVLLEPCGAMTNTNWGPAGWRVDKAIADHASLYNTKNGISNIPNDQWPEWQRLLRKLGYRFVVRSARIDGGTTFTIENVGIAPNYSTITLKYAGETKTLDRIMPGTVVQRSFMATSGTLTADMRGRVVKFANVGTISVD